MGFDNFLHGGIVTRALLYVNILLSGFIVYMKHNPDNQQKKIIKEQHRLLEAVRRELPYNPEPYFAHMKISRNGVERNILIGPETVIGAEITIIDWQKAPMAEIFFAFREGEEYELEVNGQILTGKLLQRNLITYNRDGIKMIVTQDFTLRRSAAGGYEVVLTGDRPLIRLRDEKSRREKTLSLIAPLDKTQKQAVELPFTESVLVLGEAGYGKTTVALHRLAFLSMKAKNSGRSFKSVVIVATEGLKRLCISMLRKLGTGDTKVHTYDEWITIQARRVFTKIPRRISQDASPAVFRVKRHPAVRKILPAVAGRTHKSRNRDEKPPPVTTSRDDALHLWGDQKLLQKMVDETGGELNQSMIKEVISHTRIQFSSTTEESHAHADPERLKAIDGRPLDYGTPMHDAGTNDVEDYTVLFEINRMRTGSDRTQKGKLEKYHHIVIDEAQEFAPLELAVIGRSLAPDGSLTAAGDERQQIDPTAYFSGWKNTVKDLGMDSHNRVTLEQSYRCPAQIDEFARALIRVGGSETESSGLNTGSKTPSIRFSRFGNACHLLFHLSETLHYLIENDSNATAAVICAKETETVRMHSLLRRGIDTRLALDGEFDFEPGISVTSVREVKGLEFDYVIIPDASALRFPDSAESRRALYVAATRTMHHLWLSCVGTWSPVIPGHYIPDRQYERISPPYDRKD